MATLVLTAVGTALGGPIGGALGSLVGQSIDQQLFGPGLRKGPRLGDLSIQTSSYGSPVPRLYGTMRVAGTVVWATDLKEEETVEGGGKGSAEFIAYRYSASFAVALSSRPVISVKRIWADGKLIRGAAGDFKVRTGFRLLTGSEDQPVDPLIASIETIALTGAFRGLALAVFEDLDLGEFGNRIPVLTFEVEADVGDVALSALMADASGGAIDASDANLVAGYAAHGRSIADSLAPLVELYGTELREEAGRLRSPDRTAIDDIGEDALGCSAEARQEARIERSRASDAAMPANLAMTYHDPARDYQTGQMRASSGRGGAREERIELPAVLTAAAAKQLVEDALARRLATGDQVKLALPPSRLAMQVGDRLRLPGSATIWTVRRATIEAMTAMIDATPAIVGSGALAADPGRPVSEPDVAIGRSVPLLIEPPALGDDIGDAVRAYLAVSNDAAWKPVTVETFVGVQPLAVVAATRKAVIGRAETLLGQGPSLLIDDRSELIVRLVDPAQQLGNADDDALAIGANLAMIGNELIQFGRAGEIAPGLYRLAHLLRGRRGTEWAIGGHATDEPFCKIEAASLRPIEVPRGTIGSTLAAVTHGIADQLPLPRAERILSGEALRPPSPCHLKAVRSAAGLQLLWTRRSHRGWSWIDSIDVPDDGFAERYRVTVTGPGGQFVAEATERSLSVANAELPAIAGEQVAIAVEMLAPFAASRAATATLTL